METVLDPAKAILERVASLEVERAKIEAEISSAMLAFQDVRRVQAELNTDPRRRDLEASYAADELGVALHQPTQTVQRRLAQSRRVRNLLPLTWAAHLDGRLDGYRISLIASAADKVDHDNHNLIHLDAMMPSFGESHTAAQLKAKLKRFVATWGTTDRSVKAEHQKRSVWVDHQDDGMSYLHAYIPTPDALRIEAELTARAKATSDDRTFDQRRADAFVEQMRGIIAGQSLASRAIIGITVPCTSLAGLSNEPGESFDGSFALPAEMVRELAAEAGTLFHRIITDPLGRILDVTELGRFPSAKLRIGVEIRDGTCRFPTCTWPVMECDLDHADPASRRTHQRRKPPRAVSKASPAQDCWDCRTNRCVDEPARPVPERTRLRHLGTQHPLRQLSRSLSAASSCRRAAA